MLDKGNYVFFAVIILADFMSLFRMRIFRTLMTHGQLRAYLKNYGYSLIGWYRSGDSGSSRRGCLLGRAVTITKRWGLLSAWLTNRKFCSDRKPVLSGR